jgi:GGDEF domain-containing protein
MNSDWHAFYLGQVGMKISLSEVEGTILHGLLEESSGDIVIRLDQRGFLAHASANIAEIGLDIATCLLPPHITDLATRDHAALLGARVKAVLAGDALAGWVEFPIAVCPPDDAADYPAQRHRHDTACRRWYALSLRPLMRHPGEAEGAIGLLRSVQQVRSLEGELHTRAITDPITGLANRQAFCASLARHLARGGGQMAAVLAVDGMRALLMRFGQRTADEVLWGFAKFLEAMALPGCEIAQLDGERFAVILPGCSEAAARHWCEDVLMTFAGLAMPHSSKGLKLSASAGLARIECTTDWTLREAELGLVMARAGGGGQVMRGALPPQGAVRGAEAMPSGLGMQRG